MNEKFAIFFSKISRYTLSNRGVATNNYKKDKFAICIARINFLSFLFVLAFASIICRILYIVSFVDDKQFSHSPKNKNEFVISRGDIVDRNGVLLASNITTSSVYGHPNQIHNIEHVAQSLSSVLQLNYKNVLEKLQTKKSFTWIKRHITPDEHQALHNLGLVGIYFAKDEKRIYPQNNLFSHIIGYVDIDGNGIAGLERSFNQKLLENVDDALLLSLDVRIQSIVKEEMQKALEMNSAVGVVSAVMDLNNGELLSMVSLPDFNPNKMKNVNDKQLFNQATLGLSEMGSTLKALTIAIGLDLGKIKINDAFDVSRPLKIGKFTIHDYKGKGGSLSIPEILMYSSNLGVAQIAQKFGIKQQREYLRRVGFLSQTDLELPELAKPLYPNEKRWTEASLITISYGHGIAVTPIHVMQSIGALINGGKLYKATVLKQSDEPIFKQVIHKETSDIMRSLFRLVVEKGAARRANIPGYFVGGKTGTAEKLIGGHYNKNLNMALFIGGFPMHNPQYLILVMIDEAQGNESNGWLTTGGMIAAPVAGKIISRIAPILNIIPEEIPEDIDRDLHLDYVPRYIRASTG